MHVKILVLTTREQYIGKKVKKKENIFMVE